MGEVWRLPPLSAPFQHGPRPECQPHPLDNSQYDPDPRGPNSGPSHGYQPGPQYPSAPLYSGPPNKRDLPDEPQYRTPATGPVQNHSVAPPEGYPHPHVNHSSTSGPFRSKFAPLAGPGREGHPMPYSTPAATTANTAIRKRKAHRAGQACDSCRTLKAKCDEGRPDCGSCKEKGIPCAYRDTPPKQYAPHVLLDEALGTCVLTIIGLTKQSLSWRA